MSAFGILYREQLVPMESPHIEPRLAHQAQEPRKVNNLTLIDGKTFLATNVAGDIVPEALRTLASFIEDTRFLSHLEFRIDGQRFGSAVPAAPGRRPLSRR